MVDTIPTDVSDEPGQEPAVDPIPVTDDTNPARKGIKDIYAKRRQQLEAELNEGHDPSAEKITLNAEGKDTEGGEPAPGEEQEPDTGEEPPAAAAPKPKAKAEPKPKAEAAPGAEPAAEDVEPMITVNHGGKVYKVPASSISVPVKVNGKSQDVTGKDIVGGYQMSAAGQQKLREANERLQEAYRVEQRNKEAGTVAPAAKPAEAVPPASPVDELSDDETNEMARKLQYGDEAEAAAVIRQLRDMAKKTGAPAQSEEALVNSIASRTATIVKEQTDNEAVLRETYEAYPQIFEDPGLKTQAINNVHRIRAQDLTSLGYDLTGTTTDQWANQYRAEQQRGTVRNNRDLFKLAAETTIDWAKGLGLKLGAPAPTPDPSGNGQKQSLTLKREAKRAAGAPPKAATGFQADPSQGPRPKTGPEKVAEMRAARGQPT